MLHTQYLFVEKYRPKSVDECILPASVAAVAKGFVATGDLPHLLLAGNPGTGKTTLALALCQELETVPMFINSSEENGIDTIRTKIKEFASSISLDGKRKYIILDEADYLSQSAQPALRSMLEEFAGNCGFIFTCNHPNRIIPALHSRCVVIHFNVPNDERKKLQVRFLDRIKDILDKEQVQYNEDIIVKVIKRWWPDNRKTLNEIQRACHGNELTLEALGAQTETQFDAFWTAIKAKNYRAARTWIGENGDIDVPKFYRAVFDWVHEEASPTTLPVLVITIADYQYRHLSAGVDPQIHFAALSLELMNNGQWK